MGAAAYAAAVLADSPTTYWKCQDASGALTDSSGNGNNSTGGSLTSYQQAGPMGDYSVQLASTKQVTVPVAAGGKTFELFFKDITAADSKILTYAGNNAGDGSGLMVNANLTVAYLAGGIAIGAASTGVVSTTVFKHLVMTVSTGAGPYTFKYYINGVLDATTPATANINTPSGSFFIGEPAGGNSGYYSHVATYAATLTAAQVAVHYAASLIQTRSPAVNFQFPAVV